MNTCSKTIAAARFEERGFLASVLSLNTPINVTKGGTNRAVEKYGIASVTQRETTSNRRERHRLAARLSGVTEGTAMDTAKMDTDIKRPCPRTAGKISSDDFECSSVAKRSVTVNRKVGSIRVKRLSPVMKLGA